MSEVGSKPFINSIQGSKKRPRIQMACENCRQKKVKCNGHQPCQKCQNHTECVYSTPKERKRRLKDSQGVDSGDQNVQNGSKKRSIDALSSRLNSLEKLLGNLVNRLDEGGKAAVEPRSKSSNSLTSVSSSPYSDSGSTLSPTPHSSDDGKTLKALTATVGASGDLETKKLSKFSSLRIKRKQPARDIRACKNPSYFCIITEKTKTWIKNRLRPQDMKLALSLDKLPFMLNSSILSLARAWSNVPSNSKHEILPRNGLKPASASTLPAASAANAEPGTCDFPKDATLVYGLLNSYYKRYFLANLVVDLTTLLTLFDRYYSTQQPADGTQPARRTYKYSELLIMNTALALSIQNKDDEWNKFTELYTLEDLKRLQDECFSNAIYFYERVNVVSEGLITIQGILLLYSYADAHYSTDFHINNMLTSVAIRFAQELGLNRIDVYEEMTNEEADRVRLIWWYCQTVDMDSCYKTGKSPLINLQDVSTLTELDEASPIGAVENHQDVVEIANIQGAHVYYCHYSLLFNRIRNKSYYNLFSAHSQRKMSNNFEKLIATVQIMHQEMMDLAESMHPKMRPTFLNAPVSSESDFSSPEFDKLYNDNTEFLKECSTMFKVHFFCHLMIINRVPILVNFAERAPGLDSGKVALQSSRTILLIMLGTDPAAISKINYESLEATSFVAFLTLLTTHLQDLTAQSIPKDFKLLAKFSMRVFSRGTEFFEAKDWSKLRDLDSKKAFMILAIRISLRILVGAYESASSTYLCANLPEVEKHLNFCEDIYPDAFNDASTRSDPDPLFNSSERDSSLATSVELNTVDHNGTFQTPSDGLRNGNFKKDIFGNAFKPKYNSPQDSISPQSQNRLQDFNGDVNSQLLSEEYDKLFLGNQFFANADNDFQLEDKEAISNLLFSQAYNFPNMLFDESRL